VYPGAARLRVPTGRRRLVKLTRAGVFESFAQDLTENEKLVVFAAQAPTSVESLGGAVTTPAWKTKPSSYIVATNDRAIPPGLERAMADKIKARTLSLPSSHVVMMSHPNEVAGVILEAVDKS
jgi:pimeloyl-ACP methyl ester carboxylesterase